MVKEYGGNCLEAPIYWYRLELEKGQYDMSLVKGLIDRTRAAGLKLIVLWFGTSKNGHPNYVPEYIKRNPGKYRLAKGSDGAPVASLSPHCADTLERDRRAFVKLMEFLKCYDSDMRTIAGMIPLLIRYRKTGKIYTVAEEEFETDRYIRLEDYHVVAHFMHSRQMNLGYTQDPLDEMGRDKTQIRGRALLVQTGKHEFLMGGAGVSFDFIRRPEKEDEDSYSHLSSRQSSQLYFLTVEEGHFEGYEWVKDMERNGDETNFSQYVLDGQIIRVRLNPDTGMNGEDVLLI